MLHKCDSNNQYLVRMLQKKGAIRSNIITEAFLSIPRHLFISKLYKQDPDHYAWSEVLIDVASDDFCREVYKDVSIVTAIDEEGMPTSSSTSPSLMAEMLEALDLTQGLKVLEIGTGTGYNAALLAHIVGYNFMFSLDINPMCVEYASLAMHSIFGRSDNLHVWDGLKGFDLYAPYDRIIATAGHNKVPLPWIEQLALNGVIVMNITAYNYGGILRLKKIGPGNTSYGKFLRTSHVSFINLYNMSKSDNDIYTIIEEMLDAPLDLVYTYSLDELQIQELTNADFMFFLQQSLPGAAPTMFVEDNKDSPKVVYCIVDPQSKTVIRASVSDDKAVIVVQGDKITWEKVRDTYNLWKEWQMPLLTDHSFIVDEAGLQFFELEHYEDKTRKLIWELQPVSG